jgi:hypothetical protein
LKSTDFWDVPVRKLSQPRVKDPWDAFESDTAKNVRAMKMKGSDVRRQTSMLSEKDMKTPVVCVSMSSLV